MHKLKDVTTGENHIIHVCYECDPEQYPEGKPILPSDKLAIVTKKDNGCVVSVRLRN